MFKPFQSSPQIDKLTKDDEFQLDDLDLDPDTVKVIQERDKANLEKNKEHACRALVYSQGLFMKVYNSLSYLANVTSDSDCVYLKLFSSLMPISREWLGPRYPTSLCLRLGRP